MITKKLLCKGVDQNVLVFDENNEKEGFITRKLAALMIDHAIYNGFGIIDTIYIPFSIEAECVPGNTMAGLRVVRRKGLELDGQILKYYKDVLEGTMARDTQYLIIGASRKNIILGCCK